MNKNISRAVKKWHKKKKRLEKQEALANGSNHEIEKIVAFTFGSIQEKIEGIARGAGVPQAILTARVARLLQASARGKILGA